MNEFFMDQEAANIEANGNKANSEVINSIKKNTNIETTDIVKQTSKQIIKK